MVLCAGLIACSETSSAPDSSRTPRDGAAGDSGARLDSGSLSDSGSPLDANPRDDAWVEQDAGGVRPEGTVRFLTYNVAGLPGIVSDRDPQASMPLISPLLNGFDIVVVQEDFAYHAELTSAITYEHRYDPSSRSGTRLYGDGLAGFSRVPLVHVDHQRWDECNGRFDAGNDCLAGKGFALSRHELAPGIELDVYNVHMDAGGDRDDQSARAEQVAQLIEYARTASAGRAVIVAGDTNLKAREGDEPILLNLLAGLELLDSCRQLGCEQPALHDRVMYRSSASLELTPMLWHIDSRFVNAAGEPLSDHEAIVVDFEWRGMP